MFTLADFMALNVRPDIQTQVINTIRMSSSFIETAVFQPIKSGSLRYTRRNTYPTVAARALNAAMPAESTGSFNTVTENLAIYSGQSRSDRAFIKMQNMSEVDTTTQLLTDLSTSLAKSMEADVFQGTGIVDMYGLNGRLTAIAGDQLFAIGADGVDITTSAANAQTGLRYLEHLVQVVAGPDNEKIIVMNRATFERYQHAGFLCGFTIVQDKNLLGNLMYTWRGIPIIIIERDATNTEILPTNETQGAAVTTCSSVYCIRWNTSEGCSLLTYENQGNPFDMEIDILPMTSGQAYVEVQVETLLGMAMKRDDAAARMTGIIIA